jgi:hypothetical protein
VAAGAWKLTDPKISLSFLFLGVALAAIAARDRALSISWIAVTIGGIFALEITRNVSGEVDDFAADSAMQAKERSRLSPAASELSAS